MEMSKQTKWRCLDETIRAESEGTCRKAARNPHKDEGK